MKLMLLGLLFFGSVGAVAQTTFSCPRIQEMVDYEPHIKKPVFRDMDDSKIDLTPTAWSVRISGQDWQEVAVAEASEDQYNPKAFYASYINVLFGDRILDVEILGLRWLTITRAENSPEDWEVIQAYEVTTTARTYRYLQFNRGDLAICAEPLGPF